jgi:hypothetical protein
MISEMSFIRRARRHLFPGSKQRRAVVMGLCVLALYAALIAVAAAR